MGFAAVHSFIGTAERADEPFHFLHDPTGQTRLFLPSVIADQAMFTDPSQGTVAVGDVFVRHFS